MITTFGWHEFFPLSSVHLRLQISRHSTYLFKWVIITVHFDIIVFMFWLPLYPSLSITNVFFSVIITREDRPGRYSSRMIISESEYDEYIQLLYIWQIRKLLCNASTTCFAGPGVTTVTRVIQSKPSFTKMTIEGVEDFEPSITKITRVVQGMYVFI